MRQPPLYSRISECLPDYYIIILATLHTKHHLACLASHFTVATDTTLAIEDTLTTTTIVFSDAIHFTWATLSTDISLSTGATTHYSA